MATRALQQVVSYIAWNTSTSAYVTGDSANHSLSWSKDGTRSAATNAAAEVDSTNLPGLYKCTMTATETDCIEGVLGGKSSTTNVILIPTMVAFDYLNTSAPASAGVPDVNVLNWKGSTAPANTGDAFARLGAPAGASVSADAAAIKSDTGTILTDVNTGAGAIYTRLGAPAGASIAADVASIKTDTGTTIPGKFPTNSAALVISAAGNVNADIKKVNAVTVNGDGAGTPWGP